MQFFPYSYLSHGFDRIAFEQSLPDLQLYRQQQAHGRPCCFLISQRMSGAIRPQLHLNVPTPITLVIHLPESFRKWLPMLVREVPSICGLLGNYGLSRWTSFGWDIPEFENDTGFRHIRIDPTSLDGLHDAVAKWYLSSDARPDEVIGALPIYFVCGETLGVSVTTIDADWSNEIQGCDFVSRNFNPGKHTCLGEADIQKAHTKMAAIQAMEPEIAQLFLEDCRPKLMPLFDLNSNI